MPTALVTGASGGVGLATVRALLEAGWSVHGTDVAAAPSIEAGSADFSFTQANIVDPGVPDALVKEAQSIHGRLDAHINVAGIMDYLQSVDTLDDGLWDRVIAVNLTAPVRMMGAATRAFREQDARAGAEGKRGGVIANVGSYAGISGGAAGVAYTSSKHGLVGATKNTAFRFKGEGIRCNIVCPGGVATDIMKDVDYGKLDGEFGQIMGGVRNAAHPSELILQPEQVASMLVYLVSDGSKGLNGAVIPLDNGWSTI